MKSSPPDLLLEQFPDHSGESSYHFDLPLSEFSLPGSIRCLTYHSVRSGESNYIGLVEAAQRVVLKGYELRFFYPALERILQQHAPEETKSATSFQVVAQDVHQKMHADLQGTINYAQHTSLLSSRTEPSFLSWYAPVTRKFTLPNQSVSAADYLQNLSLLGFYFSLAVPPLSVFPPSARLAGIVVAGLQFARLEHQRKKTREKLVEATSVLQGRAIILQSKIDEMGTLLTQYTSLVDRLPTTPVTIQSVPAAHDLVGKIEELRRQFIQPDYGRVHEALHEIYQKARHFDPSPSSRDTRPNRLN